VKPKGERKTEFYKTKKGGQLTRQNTVRIATEWFTFRISSFNLLRHKKRGLWRRCLYSPLEAFP